MKEIGNIQRLVSWFFDKINIPIIEGLYIDNLQNWDALCASLTILNDLQRAKEEYYKLENVNHLEVIGIMQTIYIEQDCMLTFYNAILDKSQEKYLENYSKIRSLRNEVFGHPSKKEKQKKPIKLYSRHFFDIVDAKTQSLKIINWKTTGDIDSYQFILSDKVNENSRLTREYLESIKFAFIAKIESRMKDFKVNTSELFKGSNYIFEKLLTKPNDMVISSYHTVDEDLEMTKEALIERKIYDHYQREYETLVFFSSQLKPLFYVQTYIDVEFYAYASSLRNGINSLKKSLARMDDHFGTNEADHLVVFK